MPCDKRLIQTIKIMQYHVFNFLLFSLSFCFLFFLITLGLFYIQYMAHLDTSHRRLGRHLCVCVCVSVCLRMSPFSLSGIVVFCLGAVFRAEKGSNAKRLAVGKLKPVFQVASLLSRMGTILENAHLSSVSCVWRLFFPPSNRNGSSHPRKPS